MSRSERNCHQQWTLVHCGATSLIGAVEAKTYERFTDTAAMDIHNHSAAVALFFATAKPILDGEVVLHICEEMWAT